MASALFPVNFSPWVYKPFQARFVSKCLDSYFDDSQAITYKEVAPARYDGAKRCAVTNGVDWVMVWCGVVQDHLNGKQYLGWLAIRDKYKEMQERYRERPPPPAVQGHGTVRDRAKSREYERDRCVPFAVGLLGFFHCCGCILCEAARGLHT